MGKDRGIDREIIVKALEDAMLTAARKSWTRCRAGGHYNEEAGEIEVFQFKTGDGKGCSIPTCISPSRRRDAPSTKGRSGDSLGIKIDTSTFGRIARADCQTDHHPAGEGCGAGQHLRGVPRQEGGTGKTVSCSDSREATSS